MNLENEEVFFFFKIYLFIYLFIYSFIHSFIHSFIPERQRQREREAETQAEGEAGSIQGAGCGIRSLNWDHALSQRQTLNQPLSHPGAPCKVNF